MKFAWHTDFMKVTNEHVLVPLRSSWPTISFPSTTRRASLADTHVFGRVSSLTGASQTFEDPSAATFGESLPAVAELQRFYQKAIPLRPGLYRLDIVIKDVKSAT